ncbi:uncharacterized protein [Watersipora subatra]|uniref:uncharacterized protein n=1 Tax=Watersipora subatra TaxID=2589382 RepID=UPI00355BAE09
MRSTLFTILLLAIMDIKAIQALRATACLNNHVRSTVTILCPASKKISLSRIEVAYALDSCIRELSCPLENLEPTNEYYQFLMSTCDQQQSCAVSSMTLHTDYANKFSSCSASGRVRNLVELTYSCIGASTTTLFTTTVEKQSIPQAFSLPAIITLPSMTPLQQRFLPEDAIFNRITNSADSSTAQTSHRALPTINQPSSTTPTISTPKSSVTSASRPDHSTTESPESLLPFLQRGTTTPPTLQFPKNKSSLAATSQPNTTSDSVPTTSDDVAKEQPAKHKNGTMNQTLSVAVIKDSFKETEDKTSQFAQDVALKVVDEPSLANEKWLTRILVPFLAGAMLITVILTTAAVVAKKRRRMKSSIETIGGIHDGFSSHPSLYDTISGISGFTGDYEELHCNECEVYSMKDCYSASDIGTDIERQAKALNTQDLASISVHSSLSSSSKDSSVSYELPIDVNIYDEVSSQLSEIAESKAQDMYAKIKKSSRKGNSEDKLADTETDGPVLIENDVYGCTDIIIEDNRSNNESVNNEPILVENDLYDSWEQQQQSSK